MTSQYAATTLQVAHQLRDLAERFERMGEVSFPETYVSIDLQVSRRDNTSEAERVNAVKFLCKGILNHDATDKGSGLFGTPTCGVNLDHAKVGIYTAVESMREYEMSQEIERLRAKLAERA